MGNNTGSKKKHYTKLLVDNARAFGYLNGKKLPTKVRGSQKPGTGTGGAVGGQIKL